jgi:hypothetical protein
MFSLTDKANKINPAALSKQYLGMDSDHYTDFYLI